MRNHQSRVLTYLVTLLWAAAMFWAHPTSATIVVDQGDPSCSDVAGTPYCQLVPAMQAASPDETIAVSAGTYTLSNFDLVKNVKIIGAGRNATFLDGDHASRLIEVSLGAQLELVDLTIRNGDSIDVGGCINVEGSSLIMRGCIVTGCTAATSGGGISATNGAHVELIMSTLSGNMASSGGGVSVVGSSSEPSTLRMSGCTVSGNNSSFSGGGIFAACDLDLTNVTLSGNRALHHGGGMYLGQEATGAIANATIANNWADFDYSNGGSGGGIYLAGGPQVEVRNTIIADNAKGLTGLGPDCNGTMVSGGYNLFGTTATCTITGTTTGIQIGVEPHLLPLAFNGGPTANIALDSGSPALDAGNPGGCLDAAGDLRSHDQRGFPSPQEGDDNWPVACDIGAFEAGPCLFADGFELSTTSLWDSVTP